MISKTYEVVYKRIFVLSIDNSEELICSFNVEKGNHRKQLPAAMLVHRKKETNTLYTINSLNTLVKSKTNGMLDPNFAVNWSEYKNSMLITSDGELKVLKTNVFQIINL
jgi:hypothetical protein